MKIQKSSYKFEGYGKNSASLNKFPIEYIDLGKQDDCRWNDPFTIVFTIDFAAMSPEDLAAWSLFIKDSQVDELDIKPLKDFHSYTHWVRMWWD